MDWIAQHILSVLIFFPVLGAVVVGFLPRENTRLIKLTGMAIFLVEFVLSLHLWVHMQNTGVVDQFAEELVWIQTWNVHYRLAADGLSVLLIILSTFIMPVSLLGTWNSVTQNFKIYMVSLLILLAAMVGVFAAIDLFLFYVFWEIMLVPMYLLIGVWGGKERVYAAVKFFIYTMAGSILMLVAILYLYFKAGRTFNLLELYDYRLGFHAQLWVFLALALAFAVKVPLFPVHTWLPDAHVQAPTAGSVILAGVLLKMGVYGYVRFALPLFPDAAQFFQPYLMGIAAFGVVYGALVAMVQPDIKKLIAYSSVSHMGVVMLGVFALNSMAMTGGLYQSLNHAVSTGGLFLLVGMIYDRTHTREIKAYSGLAKLMPVYALFFIIVTLSSIAVPLTNGFVGEFLALLGSFQVSPTLTTVATTGVIFGAIYMLWLVQRVFFGPVKKIHGAETDLNWREVLSLMPLVVLIVVMGVYPKPFLEKLERPSQTVIYKLDDERKMVMDGPSKTDRTSLSDLFME